jgi:hypothetical protein
VKVPFLWNLQTKDQAKDWAGDCRMPEGKDENK